MNALHVAGKSLQDLTDLQLDAIAQNLRSGSRCVGNILKELRSESSRMRQAGLSQGPEFRAILRKHIDVENALADIDEEYDDVEREKARRVKEFIREGIDDVLSSNEEP